MKSCKMDLKFAIFDEGLHVIHRQNGSSTWKFIPEMESDNPPSKSAIFRQEPELSGDVSWFLWAPHVDLV